jgi:hypothetical protein
LRQAAVAAVADTGRTIVEAGRDHGVSWPVVAQAFAAHANSVLPDEPEPVAVLRIDEVRRGKPRWIFDEQAGPTPPTAAARARTTTSTRSAPPAPPCTSGAPSPRSRKTAPSKRYGSFGSPGHTPSAEAAASCNYCG